MATTVKEWLEENGATVEDLLSAEIDEPWQGKRVGAMWILDYFPAVTIYIDPLEPLTN
jgi:hypothetical protein